MGSSLFITVLFWWLCLENWKIIESRRILICTVLKMVPHAPCDPTGWIFMWYPIKITTSLSNLLETKSPPSIVFLPHPLADTKPPPTILFLSHTAFSTALVLARRPTRVPILVAAGSPRWVRFFGILHFLNGVDLLIVWFGWCLLCSKMFNVDGVLCSLL